MVDPERGTFPNKGGNGVEQHRPGLVTRELAQRRFLTFLGSLILVVAQSGCAGATPISAHEASLNVTIQRPVTAPDGLSGQIDAAVAVTTPDGTTLALTRGELLVDIVPGEYVVEPRDVFHEGRRFVGLPGTTSVTVIAGQTVTVPISYVDAESSLVFGDPAPVTIKPGSRAFHIDCAATGNDGDGLSAVHAFATLTRVAELELVPGDRILLRRGCSWRGPLTLGWRGTQEWPIVIGSYGEGSLPTIHDALGNNVDVYGSHLIIENLAARTSPGTVPVDPACRDQPVGWRTGFTVQHEAHDITIRFSQASGHTAGIHVTRGARHNRIVNNELRDNTVMSINTDDGGFDDSGAWGVVLNGTDNVVAYNRFSGNIAWCSYDFGQEGASIEVYEGIRNLIHHNISIEDTTFSEIGGSDIRRAADNTYAFNVYSSSLPNSEFLVLRGAAGHFGPTPGTRAFNNTVYLTNPSETQGVVCYSGCGPEVLELRNNLFWVEWKGLYADAPFAESHNLYWRTDGHPLLQFFGEGNAISPTSIVADPQFVDAANGDLRPTTASPAVGAGLDVDVTFTRDAGGTVLDAYQGVDMGAFRRP